METWIAKKFVEADLDALIAALPADRQRGIRLRTLQMELEIAASDCCGRLPLVFPASGARLVAVLPDGTQVELQDREGEVALDALAPDERQAIGKDVQQALLEQAERMERMENEAAERAPLNPDDVIDFEDILNGLPEDEQREIREGADAMALALENRGDKSVAEVLESFGIRITQIDPVSGEDLPPDASSHG